MKRIFIAILFIAGLSMTSTNVFAQSESRDDVIKQIETKRAELSALEKNFLSPSAEDRAAYAEFLQQPHTGLIRLLPRETYDSNVLKENLKGLSVRGGGAYYSFARLTHEYGYGSDIELSSGDLSVGFAGADFGMLTKLVDLPFEEITLEHPGMKFLAAYIPPGELPKARLEQRRFGGKGVTIDNQLYQRRMPVEVNTTYLLRSINYDDSDVLVAFRVIRKDTDGSLIIAWKLLKNFPKPELIRNITEQ
jgi:hypothetical protein